MIADLKPYADYKDSGLPWLGHVPAHWELRPAFGAFVPIGERNIGMREKTVLSLSYGRIVVKPAYKLHGLVPESFETYQIVNPGDIVIRTTDLQNDHASLRVAIVRDRGIITSAYLALHLKAGVNPEFGYQFLNVWDMTKAIYGYGSGLRQGLDFTHFKRMPVALPPPAEQDAVVRFLSWATGRLERTIRAKHKVIALLTEQKQAIINRAITRGIAGVVQLMPSGNSLLEHIPAHWELSSLRRRWQVLDCKHLTVPFVEDGIPLASVVQVRNFTLDLSNCKRTKPVWFRQLIEGDRRPKRGDLIYCRNASVGSCAIVDTDLEFAMGQDVCLIRSTEQNQRFLNYVLHSPFMKHQLDLRSVGSTFKRINVSDIKALTIPVPPRFEQDLICTYLDSELSRFEVVTSRIAREIDLLREYRTRLIAEVVTGKLDVREAVRSLSDEEVTDLLDEPADGANDPEHNDEEAEA